VGYAGCVSELKRGRGAVVSGARAARYSVQSPVVWFIPTHRKSWGILTGCSRPPSIVIILQIYGEAGVRYVRCVSELKRGRGADVSRAGATRYSV
jgi:hypothetical protein